MSKTANKALIIDDEQAISSLCKRMLELQGYLVATADNGEDAEDLVTQQEYDLILLDIRLPKVNGIEFYMWLLQEYPMISKNVIFMTGSVLGGESLSFLQNSGRLYILKPFRPSELQEKIDLLMNSK